MSKCGFHHVKKYFYFSYVFFCNFFTFNLRYFLIDTSTRPNLLSVLLGWDNYKCPAAVLAQFQSIKNNQNRNTKVSDEKLPTWYNKILLGSHFEDENSRIDF